MERRMFLETLKVASLGMIAERTFKNLAGAQTKPEPGDHSA